MLIRPDGKLVGTNGINTNAWEAISNENGQLTGGTLYVDRTGIFVITVTVFQAVTVVMIMCIASTLRDEDYFLGTNSRMVA